ncbi:DciA family protein [Streptomyces mexicanus]|uniref:DUF721 domain-containing protein n=1 Tax=Streptomyces mexicanus TaxID=178566 RepID=A0A7X1I4H1_9ACTN|nr:DciA family protein [Streptomyces mexicanus]MBC2868620.1 DUF721 domain-containing protein [Streptomyces mexicanus]
MTETPIPAEQAAVDCPALSGVDLARVALHAAREAARKGGASEARIPRRRHQGAAVKRDGREPAGFAAVLQGLMAERAWAIPAAGGSVLDHWPDIAAAISPRLPEHVQAVAFHPETGQLDLRPDSPAYATQLRLITARIITTANQAAGTEAVRTVRVLAASATPAPRMPESASHTAGESQAPVKTREMASDGYLQALAAHQAARPDRHVDPAIAEAIESQTRALRELSRRAFPDPDPDEQFSPIEVARAQRRRQAAATEAAALRRARAERAQRAGRETETAQLPVVQRTA